MWNALSPSAGRARGANDRGCAIDRLGSTLPKCGGTVALEHFADEPGAGATVVGIVALGSGFLCGFLGGVAAMSLLAGAGRLAGAATLSYCCHGCKAVPPVSGLTAGERSAIASHQRKLWLQGFGLVALGVAAAVGWVLFGMAFGPKGPAPSEVTR